MMLAGYYIGQPYLGSSDETIQDERPLPSRWPKAATVRSNWDPATGPTRSDWQKPTTPAGNWDKTAAPRTNWNPAD